MARAARAFLAALTRDLSEKSDADPGLAPFARDLDQVETADVQRGPFETLDHPAMKHLERALETARACDGLLGPALVAARALDWHQVYAGGGIEDSLAEGMLASQAAGNYGCFASRTLATGQFLLAPGIHYPAHTHAATEIYYCLSGRLQIQHGLEGAPFELLPGDYSITPPHRLHTLDTGSEPALVIYFWRGDMSGPTWWWSRDESGAWRRTAWLRTPGEPWKPLRSEPVTEAVMQEAHA